MNKKLSIWWDFLHAGYCLERYPNLDIKKYKKWNNIVGLSVETSLEEIPNILVLTRLDDLSSIISVIDKVNYNLTDKYKQSINSKKIHKTLYEDLLKNLKERLSYHPCDIVIYDSLINFNS